MAQLSHLHKTTGKTRALTIRTMEQNRCPIKGHLVNDQMTKPHNMTLTHLFGQVKKGRLRKGRALGALQILSGMALAQESGLFFLCYLFGQRGSPSQAIAVSQRLIWVAAMGSTQRISDSFKLLWAWRPCTKLKHTLKEFCGLSQSRKKLLYKYCQMGHVFKRLDKISPCLFSSVLFL